MANPLKGHEGHSAEYFGDTRDHWWNRDYLALVARRWGLASARDVLDVGCGIGHWGRILGSVLADEARIVGVDREAAWVEEATARAAAAGVGERFSYRTGEAQRLPFSDGSFDLVTCQTVLIHMADPAAVIAEMKRVTRPGGRVLVAEPNNLTASLLLDSASCRMPIEDVMVTVRLQLTCERGKIALGEGDNSLGDRVPGLFTAAGLVDVRAYVNDKAGMLVPPYASPGERALVDDARDCAARGRWNWSEAETRRFFLAGGGAEADFAAAYAAALAAQQRTVDAMNAGTLSGVQGGAFFLVTGTKT